MIYCIWQVWFIYGMLQQRRCILSILLSVVSYTLTQFDIDSIQSLSLRYAISFFMEKLSYNLDFEDSKYFLPKGFLILAPHYAVKNSFSPFF